MQERMISVKSSAGLPLSAMLCTHDGATENHGLVQILHGMQEHKERYLPFSRFLCDNGYDVLLHDHLGHGKSVSAKHPLGDMVTMENVLEDIDRVRHAVPEAPRTICFGHSMGSFLARLYAAQRPVDLLIACGTGQTPTLMARVVQAILFFCPKHVPLASIQKLVMGGFQKRGEGPLDWLSVNEENQKRYAADPLCGQPFTREGYHALMDIVCALNREETYEACTAKRILLIAGEKDPVGAYTKGVEQAARRYRATGKNVTMHFYPNMAHEILNENGADEVMQDILDFMKA